MPDYRLLWSEFATHGVIQEDLVPPLLLQSWRRCAALELDCYGAVPDAGPVIDAVPSSSAHLAFVRPVMEDLYQFAEGSACVVAFADANACILDLVGDSSLREAFAPLGVRHGAVWREEVQGTNALALALRESFPAHVSGMMHYRAALHQLYTSAAPVHDPLGQSIGVLAVIGPHDCSHPHTLGMVTAAAQAISNQFQMHVWLNNANNLLTELRTILQSLPEGILLLRRDGRISQMNAPAGTMLGLIPARVTGQRIQEVIPLPPILTHALTTEQPLSDEEVVFETRQGRVTCLCTLKVLPGSLAPVTPLTHPATTLEPLLPATEPLAESSHEDGFMLLLRSLERVQRLVHRMTGTRARLTFEHVIGESPVLREALRLARLAAHSNSTVLLHGETGTGKEIFAQSIHTASARADGPFVAVNCAAIPRELITTELFGYEGGAFTGADRQGRPGKFEQAQGGTLFLDEIGDMPLELQTSLLRAIETRTIVRVGGQRSIHADVRIVAATHKQLREEVQRGTFRADLYYRLNVLTIHIPALRERAEDIPLLVRHFLLRQSRTLGRPLSITPEALAVLQRAPWSGNVRELENLLERISYLLPNNTIGLSDLPPELLPVPYTPTAATEEALSLSPIHALTEKHSILKEQSTLSEVRAILEAYNTSNGHLSQAAASLGISRTTLWRKMSKYGLLPAKKAR
jgi:transcriptional regulator of acetoin/glycerol metabolism